MLTVKLRAMVFGALSVLSTSCAPRPDLQVAAAAAPGTCAPARCPAPSPCPPPPAASQTATTAEPAAAAAKHDLALESLVELGAKPVDPRCAPSVGPLLAEALYQTAERLIAREDEHVSLGGLRTILPLLRLAAHSGHKQAQARYGYYVIGYYSTDEMFWPHDKDTAADAFAMLHLLAVDSPELLGDNVEWILPYLAPVQPPQKLPREWVERAKRIELEYRRCHQPGSPAK